MFMWEGTTLSMALKFPMVWTVYSGRLNLMGVEHEDTLGAANNYALSLISLERFEEATALLRQKIPGARRVRGDDYITLGMRVNYAMALYKDAGAALDDLREAVTTLEDVERIARRVLGSPHPVTVDAGDVLRQARAALRTRETPSANA